MSFREIPLDEFFKDVENNIDRTLGRPGNDDRLIEACRRLRTAAHTLIEIVLDRDEDGYCHKCHALVVCRRASGYVLCPRCNEDLSGNLEDWMKNQAWKALAEIGASEAS